MLERDICYPYSQQWNNWKKKKKLLQSNKDENYPREDGQIYQEKMHKGT